ncbi:MAG: hypothetical protein ACLQJ7_15995 [Syntrophobacteraceae bacterium]
MSAQRKKMRTEFGNVYNATDPCVMHERIGNLWLAWLGWVFVLEDAEVYLGEQEAHREHKGEVVMPMLLCVRAMLLGYAIECALKALWVRKGNKLIRDGKYRGVTGAKDHNLPQLGQAAGFIPTPTEDDVLRRLSKFSQFAGRYPVGKTADEMKPDVLTNADVGFFSKKDFRTAESILNKVVTATSGKKRRGLPRRPRRRL